MLNAIYHEGFSIMRTDNGFELVVCYDGDFCQEYEYWKQKPPKVVEYKSEYRKRDLCDTEYPYVF